MKPEYIFTSLSISTSNISLVILSVIFAKVKVTFLAVSCDKMANNPLDFPKSKIPVPESPYLSQSRSGFLADLSDQVFFDENVPAPIGPPPKRSKSPPYSYGPPGILHDPGAITGPAGSPHGRKSRRRRPTGIASPEYVDSRLEELLGPSAILDVDDRVDDILIDSISRKGSRENFGEPRDSLYYHGRHTERSPRRRVSPNARPLDNDSLGIPGESETGRKDSLKGRSKDRPSSKPEARASEKASIKLTSDKPPGGPPVPPSSPKKSPAKQLQKGKDGKEVKIVVNDVTVNKNGAKKAQESLAKSDANAPSKDQAGAGPAAGTKGKLVQESKGNGNGKDSDKEKDKSQKLAGDGKGKDKPKEPDSGPTTTTEPQPPTKPAFAGTDIYGHPGIDLSKLDEHKREEVMRDHAAGMKLLQLCQTGDWNAVESQLRYFETRQQKGMPAGYKPLATIRDEVNFKKSNILTFVTCSIFRLNSKSNAKNDMNIKGNRVDTSDVCD